MSGLPIIAKECDICRDKIGLYQPWYSVRVTGHLALTKGLKHNPTILCRECFHAYQNFLTEHEVQENHRKHMQDIKNV